MFRNRRSSQKPNDELYTHFKEKFPGVGPITSTSASTSQGTIAASQITATIALPGIEQLPDVTEPKDEATPRATADAWRFTPLLLDPNNFTFSSYMNPQPGYLTPTPGSGMNTVYHHQAGDLHTPGMTFHLGTPLSMPIPDTTAMANPNFSYLQGFHTQVSQNPIIAHQSQFFVPPPTFHPSLLVHQDSGFENVDVTPDSKSPAARSEVPLSLDSGMIAPVGHSNKSPVKFRYQAMLNAPTAMIKDSGEIPITYLNKGQAYTLSIVDGIPLIPSPSPIKYRTVVRISFEDEQQRQKPSACWQLWKEGRGLAEAHLRAGKLQAVDYVDPHAGGDDGSRRSRVELEAASFDSFSVTWMPPSNGLTKAECTIVVRFNFLSTDFSHSKGVKGIPVRLCAKTEILSSGTPELAVSNPEVCYCKVKLFRDHGAERKLSNDVAHVKKTIDKLKQQIAQVESGMKDVGKRKRSGSNSRSNERPEKVSKHKRTWSISSQSSTGRPAVEEDLHQKLAAAQDMFTSTRPASLLYLKADEHDDPDLYPVNLPGKNQELSNLLDRRDSILSKRRDSERSPDSSEHATSQSPGYSGFCSVPKDLVSVANQSHLYHQRLQWSSSSNSAPGNIMSLQSSSDHLSQLPTKVSRVDTSSTEWIDAIGIDDSYHPPPEHLDKPIACFYVLVRVLGRAPLDEFYRAVYLPQRTIRDLITGVAAKSGVISTQVHRVLRINPRGLKIVVDDEMVRGILEGQDMAVEFHEISKPEGIEADAMVTEGVLPLGNLEQTPALEMRLLF